MEYIVNCEKTLIRPSLLMSIIDETVTLNVEATQQARKLFLLAGALPDVPAGVLLDLVEGVAKCKIKGEKFIITIGTEQGE